jgi:hypothetical protein
MPMRCDPKTVATFGYSGLDAAFAKLSKPAQRTLLNAKIRTPKDLAKWTQKDIAALIRQKDDLVLHCGPYETILRYALTKLAARGEEPA